MTNENMMKAKTIRHMAESIFEQNMDLYDKILALDIEEFNSIHVNDVEITHLCSDDENPEFTVENGEFEAFRIRRIDGKFAIDAYNAAYHPTTWDEVVGSENFNLEQIEMFAGLMDSLREVLNESEKCIECGKVGLIYVKGLCKKCYNYKHYHDKKPKKCSECGKMKKIHSKGLCFYCYRKKCEKTRELTKCIECGEMKVHYAKGMCGNCYRRRFKLKRRERKTEEKCKNCGEMKVLRYKGLCQKCYYEESKKYGICIMCGQEAKIAGRECCNDCYRKLVQKVDVCLECNTLSTIYAKGVCSTCYSKLYR